MSVESSDKTENMAKYAEKMLTMKEYIEHPYVKGDGRSHVFTIEKNGKKLVYFGTAHTNKKEDPLFTEIQKQFDEAKSHMMFVEGMRHLNEMKEQYRSQYASKSLDDCKNEGDPSFALKLAVDAGIDFESPEPRQGDEIRHVLELGYEKKDIYAYYMYRIIYQYQRGETSPTVEGCKIYLQRYMDVFRTNSEWDSDELDVLERHMLEEIGTGDKNRFKRSIDPIPWDGKEYGNINKVSDASGRYRDVYILSRIIEGLKKYDTVFVVYGASHAVIEEPALREYFEQEV